MLESMIQMACFCYLIPSLSSICELSRVSITMLTCPSGEIRTARPIQHVDYWAFIEYGCAYYQYDELEELIRVRILLAPHPFVHMSSISTNL